MMLGVFYRVGDDYRFVECDRLHVGKRLPKRVFLLNVDEEHYDNPVAVFPLSDLLSVEVGYSEDEVFHYDRTPY